MKPNPKRFVWPDDQSAISTPAELIEEAKAGRIFIMIDDEDRENEGDLTMAAEMITPEAINFMATHGRGLICVALTGQFCCPDALGPRTAKPRPRRGLTLYAKAITGSGKGAPSLHTCP